MTDQIDELKNSFSLLRTRAVWKDSINGGAYTVHVQRRVVAQAWNIHLHALCEGTAVESDEISYSWSLLTGATVPVEIRSIDTEQYRYNMASYIGRPEQEQLFGLADRTILFEYAVASKGRRLKDTFGTFRGFPLLRRRGRSDGLADNRHER